MSREKIIDEEAGCDNCLFGNDKLTWKYIYCEIEKCFTIGCFHWKSDGHSDDCGNWKIKKNHIIKSNSK
jgi:hypothetical protein